MQDIINKIDERVNTLVIFEQHELIPSNGTLAALLALHEDVALALRRIDTWQRTLELWLRATGPSSIEQGKSPTASKLITGNQKDA